MGVGTGRPGPVPRREDERRRTNAPDHPIAKLGTEQLGELPFEVDLTPEPPAVPENEAPWHWVVQRFYDDLQRDPARKWMTAADWAATALFCEAISRELSEQIVNVSKEGVVTKDTVPPKGATLSAFLKLLEHIGVTEAARLRLQKEITLFPPPPTVVAGGNVTDINTARHEEVQ